MSERTVGMLGRLKGRLHFMALTKKWSPAVTGQLAGGSLDVASRTAAG